MPTRSVVAKVLAVGLVQACLVLSGTTQVAAQQWIASWGSSLHGLSREDQTITDATIRLIARSTVAGDRVRVRLENTYGTHPLTIGAAAIGVRNNGPSLVIGSNRPLRFDGSPSVTIPAGDSVLSDHVFLDIQAEQELAVSLYVAAADVRSNVHRLALTTSYLTEPGAGDQTNDVEGSAYPNTTQRMHWLSAVEVYSSSARGAIVAFGDSITDGSCATPDGHDRWGDVLYGRLSEAGGTARLGMVNSGIAGNTTIQSATGWRQPGGGADGPQRVEPGWHHTPDSVYRDQRPAERCDGGAGHRGS